MSPEMSHAQCFVDMLAWNGPMCWQTFDDAKVKRRNLTAVKYGRLGELSSWLTRMNRKGAGIFATVNETDGMGRRAENVIALRALFTDDDGGGSQKYPVTPTFVVRSARGPQAYWVLRGGEPLSRFRSAQTRLARALGTDDKVIDLPRVMRVPGFYHRKGKPVLVTFEPRWVAKRYTIDEVLASLPEEPKRERRHSPPSCNTGWRNNHERPEWWRDLRKAIPMGSRNGELFRFAMVMRKREGMQYGEIRDAIADINNRLCEEPVDDLELDTIARSASRY